MREFLEPMTCVLALTSC